VRTVNLHEVFKVGRDGHTADTWAGAEPLHRPRLSHSVISTPRIYMGTLRRSSSGGRKRGGRGRSPGGRTTLSRRARRWRRWCAGWRLWCAGWRRRDAWWNCPRRPGSVSTSHWDLVPLAVHTLHERRVVFPLRRRLLGGGFLSAVFFVGPELIDWLARARKDHHARGGRPGCAARSDGGRDE
jgi:hypothetical protein